MNYTVYDIINKGIKTIAGKHPARLDNVMTPPVLEMPGAE
jgi:hypothetical protein